MAERLDAILAVNGDFYGFRDTGYVIRNGVLYRSEKKSDDAQDLGCTTAYNLDGGGSTTMYFNGEVINNPASGRKSSSERSVSDIVYIGY